MTNLQFRVLYRQFLFRMVDLELLSPEGEMSKLLGQFAGILIFLSIGFTLSSVGFNRQKMPAETALIFAWNHEHTLIATTLLVVGLFAVLSWDSTFPDRRDVMVLAPLPVRARTLFFAKVAALGSALSLTVVALNALTGITWPFALASADGGLAFSLDILRSLFAYWVTMLAAGAFIFGSVLTLQGLSAQLPRPIFLRLSALLQMAAFGLFVSVYFLEPSLATPEKLSNPSSENLLAMLPSYWFLGLFERLNGSTNPAMVALASRAWLGLAVASLGAVSVFLLSYFRTLRKIVEQPDIVPAPRSSAWLPRFGNSLETAVVQFSIRTLLRSRQHRVMLAFYLGVGFASVFLFLKTPTAQHQLSADPAKVPLLFSSAAMMCLTIVGIRVVLSMPLSLRANWVFRVTEVTGMPVYMAAIRRPLFVLAVAPLWIISAAVFLSLWPWRQAAGHLVVLGLLGSLLAYISLFGFHKIPFTCSYLPGKSQIHMIWLAVLGFQLLIGEGVRIERRALDHPGSYAIMVAVFVIAVLCARWQAVSGSASDGAMVQFEDLPAPAVMGLGLHRDGTFPIPSLRHDSAS